MCAVRSRLHNVVLLHHEFKESEPCGCAVWLELFYLTDRIYSNKLKPAKGKTETFSKTLEVNSLFHLEI